MSAADRTSHAIDVDLHEVSERFEAMSRRCRTQLTRALHAFWARSKEEAASVAAFDDRIDDDERSLDALILRVLALRQPVASDLRVLTACLKLVTDLERIGDGAVNIADAAVRGEDGYDSESLHRLGAATEAIVAAATSSFLQRDENAAREVARAQAAIVAMHRAATEEMVAFASTHPDAARSVVAALSVARALERIADHAANIAEGTRFALRDAQMPR